MRIINKKMMIGIISLIVLLSLSSISFSADSNEFESTINIATSTARGLTVALIEPDMNEYGIGDLISFKAVASYNKSIDLSCELVVDNNVINTMAITGGNELIVSKPFTFNKGTHDWLIRCADAIGNSASSSTKKFVVDLQGPSITLNNNNPDLSFYDHIELRFTPSDDYSSNMDCKIFVDDVEDASVSVSDKQEKKVTVDDIEDGTHRWKVICKDEKGNEGISPEYSFSIDTKTSFSLVTNEETYDMGGMGIFYVTAPEGSTAKVIITDPIGGSVAKSLNSPFPAMDSMGPFYYEGEYTITAYINLDGGMKETSKKFMVNTNMHVDIDEIDKKTYTNGSTVSFEAEGKGGYGTLTYTWNFDDKTSEVTGASVSHQYNRLGTFDATVTVKDEKGNKATNSVRIKIEETNPVKIMVVNDINGAPVSGATVYLDGEERSTDSSGAAYYNMFIGKYPLVIKKDNYKTYDKEINVQRNLTTRAILQILTVNESVELSLYSQSSSEEDEMDVDDDSLASEIRSAIADVESALSSFSDNEEYATLKIKEGLERARGQLNMANRDLLNLKANSIELTKEEISNQKKAIEEKVQNIKDTTIISYGLEDKNDIIMILSDSEVDTVSQEYLKSIEPEYTSSQLKSLQQSNRNIKSSLSVNRRYSVGSLEYLSGSSKEITLVIDRVGIKDRVPGSSLVLFVPKEIASNAKEMNIITENTIINEDPLIEFNVDEKDVAYYFNKQLTKEEIKQILPSLMSSGDERVSGITGFAIMPDLGEIDSPLLIIEMIIIAVLVLAFFVYQFDVVERVKGINPINNELRQAKFLIGQTRDHIKRKDLDSAEESYRQLTKEFKTLKAIEKSKVEKHVKDIDCLMIFAKLDSEADRALQYIKEGKHSKAKASYSMIKDIYKGLPKEYKAKACNKCEDLFRKLSL